MSTASLSISNIAFPPREAVLDRAAAGDFVGVLRGWLADATDRVFALDAQLQSVGPDASPSDQADVAAAFLAHQAIGNRIAEMGAPDGHTSVAELCYRTVVADDGSPIAANLADACVLFEAMISRAETSLARTATTVQESLRLRGAIHADLDVAAHLAQRLGDQVRHVHSLSERATQAIAALANDTAPTPDTSDLERLAAEIAKVRAALEAADAERQQLIGSWTGIPGRLDAMRAQATSVRELRARCEEKVRPLPKLAVPSIDAIEAPLEIEQLELQPWPAVEPKCRTYLHHLDRVQAALDEVQRRYAEPLRERDELRGLVQAFHDKAGESGLEEHVDLDPAYRAAVDELWSAPCDLVKARELVERYIAAVNRITNGETATTTGDSPT